jgi:hypothetical protein
MRADVVKARSAAARIILVAALAFAMPARAQNNPSMSADFTSMMGWLSTQIAQGLGFSAGETLDTPHEVLDKRIQPDISFGAGNMPLNKSQFPALQTPALSQLGVENIFPSSVLFPNLSAHLRAGLPWRMDLDIRGADMTTPPNYKISPTATASGHSNSIGFGVRKHFFGGENPMLTMGLNYNHVFGAFDYNTTMAINVNNGLLTGNAAVAGNILWNVNSYGLNAVISQKFGHWTPFVGLGESYVTGSVRTSLNAVGDFEGMTLVSGAASAKPEQFQARMIGGWEWSRSWVNLFTSGEIKAGGVDGGKSFIVQSGISLPFHIGFGGGGGYASSRAVPKTNDDRPRRSRRPESTTVFVPAEPDASSLSGTRVGGARREMFGGPVAHTAEAPPPLIFIQ